MASAKKVLRAGLVALLCGVGPSVVHAWDEPKGFRGVPWGASKSTVQTRLGLNCPDACVGLLLIRTAKGLVQTESLLHFEPRVGGLELYTMTFVSEEFELVREAFRALYGEPTEPTLRPRRVNIENEILHWKGETVVISLSKYVSVTKGATMHGIATVQTRKAWQRNLVEPKQKPVPDRKGSCDGRRVCEETADGQYVYRTETGRPQRWYFLDGRLAPRAVWPKGPAKPEATEKRDSGSVPLTSGAAPRAVDLPLSQQASLARREGDHPRARTLFEQACKGGDAKACFEVGHMFRMGSGGASDDTQARVFYEKACTGGDGSGCFNLGYLFSAGIGGPQDGARAQALYEQACQAGEPSACSRLDKMPKRAKPRGSRGPEAPPAAR